MSQCNKEELDYAKMWRTLKAESGYRVTKNYEGEEAETVVELMISMQERMKKINVRKTTCCGCTVIVEPEQETIYIDGYYLDGDKKEAEFKNRECLINVDGRNVDYYDIFYYFKDEEDLKLHMVTENNTNNEFVVTKVQRDNK